MKYLDSCLYYKAILPREREHMKILLRQTLASTAFTVADTDMKGTRPNNSSLHNTPEHTSQPP